jgi:hypothetical protein
MSAGLALGQSINVDFGQPNVGPPDTYAGAGLAGVWNSIEGEHTPFTNPQVIYDLVDLDGQPTGVTLYQFGGMELIDVNDPGLVGEENRMMRDALVTHSTSLETCLWINGLENGTYEVITYGWMPNHPEIDQKVRLDFNPNVVIIGGAWPGQQVEGVTYARHIQEVTTGFIGLHVGVPQGGNTVIGSANNGFQLVFLDDCADPVLDSPPSGIPFAEAAFDGYIDPRMESTNGVDLDLGLSELAISFNVEVEGLDGSALSADDFAVSSSDGDPPVVTGVDTEDNTSVTLTLDRTLTPGTCLTVSAHVRGACNGTPIAEEAGTMTIGSLPGDIDNNGRVQPLDLLRMRQALSGVLGTPFQGSLEDFADIDRNGSIQALDLLRWRQIWFGSGNATQAWDGASLDCMP